MNLQAEVVDKVADVEASLEAGRIAIINMNPQTVRALCDAYLDLSKQVQILCQLVRWHVRETG